MKCCLYELKTPRHILPNLICASIAFFVCWNPIKEPEHQSVWTARWFGVHSNRQNQSDEEQQRESGPSVKQNRELGLIRHRWGPWGSSGFRKRGAEQGWSESRHQSIYSNASSTKIMNPTHNVHNEQLSTKHIMHCTSPHPPTLLVFTPDLCSQVSFLSFICQSSYAPVSSFLPPQPWSSAPLLCLPRCARQFNFHLPVSDESWRSRRTEKQWSPSSFLRCFSFRVCTYLCYLWARLRFPVLNVNGVAVSRDLKSWPKLFVGKDPDVFSSSASINRWRLENLHWKVQYYSGRRCTGGSNGALPHLHYAIVKLLSQAAGVWFLVQSLSER